MKKLLFIAIELVLPILLLSQNSINNSDTYMKDVKGSIGDIGLNLLGFRVNVGVRPFVALNGIGGTVHAQAGTPFGQYAVAGAQGQVGIRGASGAVYAQATAGEGVAAAGVGAQGDVGSSDGPEGTIYAESYNGNVFRGVVLGISDGQTLSMLQERVQSQILSDTSYTVRNSDQNSKNKTNTSSYISVKVEEIELQPTKPHQNSSSLFGNSSIVSFIQKWMENRSFTDDNSRSKFFKEGETVGTDNDSDKSGSLKNVSRDGVFQNSNSDPYYDENSVSEKPSKSYSLGLLSYFRQWIHNKTITDDDSRSKFIETNK